MKGNCQVPGCFHIHAARGRCKKHYSRLMARMRVPHAAVCQCGDCLKLQRRAFDEELAGREPALLEKAS